ncbi:hypothetical protein evm_010958 [Chilo suppressalis]|nr:hypothetical protein evm_010958 [Chilo suppressalis]
MELHLRLNHAICGFSPWWWHACNVALHAACCALVARTGAVVARLQRPFAALAALLFAVHPVHTEAAALLLGSNLFQATHKRKINKYEGDKEGCYRKNIMISMTGKTDISKEGKRG